MKVFQIFPLAGVVLLTLGLSSCIKDNGTSPNEPRVTFEITDSPIDDANISGVFVTVASIKVDGEEISNFIGKKTINLLALQNGDVEGLGYARLQAGTYNDVRLVLNHDQDGAGNAPGSYVLLKSGDKQALKTAASTANEIVLTTNAPLVVESNSTSTAVIDFDLRKAIRYRTGGSSAYEFVTDAEINSSVRLVTKSETGTITGKVKDTFTFPGSKIVVYAYKKGSYTATEKNPQGDSGIRFKNAVSSAVADENGNFTLAFLQAGDYDLHFVNYDDTGDDGKFVEKGALLLDVVGGLDLTSITVAASATVSLDLTVVGIVPL